MKNVILLLCGVVVLSASCKRTCTVKEDTCSDRPPTDELCEAYFERWFYNSRTDKCELIGYSGCSQKGFATKRACESCVDLRD
jgi:hypothetical protein